VSSYYTISAVRDLRLGSDQCVDRSAGAEAMNEYLYRLEGAPSVLLETVKRGEDDFDVYSFAESEGKSVVLRMYEHKGGHAIAQLRM
jgi:alpha-mannosidase